ncbi:MAG: hypothetical protein ACRD3O_18275 [Terriglobia bacterium]
MRTESFHGDDLARFLHRHNVATMPELKRALGTEVDVTVFRKLKPLAYRTSYSHRGSYYTLDELARFDEHGLWGCRGVWFSRYGTLLSTVESFVNRADAGYFIGELDPLLHVQTKEPLRQLVRQARLARQPVAGLFLYLSADPARRQRQRLARQQRQAEPRLAHSLAGREAVPDELKAALVLFFSLLDEKQRRVYAGLQSLEFGYGGDRRVAEFLGLDPHTVAQGRRQLLARDFEIERVRKAGGGRKRVEKKPPKSSPTSNT